MSIVREKILGKIRMTIYSPHSTVFKLDVHSRVGEFSNVYGSNNVHCDQN